MSIAFLNPLLIQDSVRRALEEDLGRAGDITTTATIPASAGARAVIASREAGVIAGLPLAEAAFHMIAPGLRFIALVGDGGHVNAGDVVAEIEGSARAVLSAACRALPLSPTASCGRWQAPTAGLSAPAKPHRVYALSRNMPCAAAAGSTTATGWMMPC